MCIFLTLFKWQSQFKSAGNKLVPDGATEQALMYQRMFEGLTFFNKLSKTNTIFRCQYMAERSKIENKGSEKQLLC